MLVKKTASCLDMLTWFEQNNQVVPFPLPGDVAFFKYATNSRRTNHVGIVFHVNSQDSFKTIEGNTSINSDDNGGAVMIRQRTRKNLVSFARPKYPDKNVLNKVLALANTEVGITEYPPNSNNVKYNTWYYGHAVSGKNYPWCATFISYIFASVDSNIVIPSTKPVTQTYPTIRRGSKGQYVKVLQNILINKNYILQVDGDFGPMTEKAVKDFQTKSGLKPDGIVGPLTWAMLTK